MPRPSTAAADPLYLLVEKAYDAMHRLSIETHYLLCGIGAPTAVGLGPLIEEADDMCGRYVCSKAPEVYGSFYDVIVPPIAPNFDVAPTHNAPVVRINDGKRECVLQRWGLTPSWAKDKKMNLINARADTLFVKPAFRASAKRRRCLILADGYYEWKTLAPKKKQPYYFRPKDDRPIAFAGIWDCWKGEAVPIESCSIITTDANELSRPIHAGCR